MKPYQMHFTVTAEQADPNGLALPSTLLYFAQEAAGEHCRLLGADRQALSSKNLFWAVIRHKLEITRLPAAGEAVLVETWPMPTTRSAYPRSTAGYDTQGNLLFQIISLWVLMDVQTRAMVLPGKSGVQVEGMLRGDELASPGSIAARPLPNCLQRTVTEADLDINLHMNNTQYLDWIWDLQAQTPFAGKPLRGCSMCYLSEALLGQALTLTWDIPESGTLQVAIFRENPDTPGSQERVFSALLVF